MRYRTWYRYRGHGMRVQSFLMQLVFLRLLGVGGQCGAGVRQGKRCAQSDTLPDLAHALFWAALWLCGHRQSELQGWVIHRVTFSRRHPFLRVNSMYLTLHDPTHLVYARSFISNMA